MTLEEFIQHSIRQIKSGCFPLILDNPKSIEFSVQVNSDGDVCKEGQISVATIKVIL